MDFTIIVWSKENNGSFGTQILTPQCLVCARAKAETLYARGAYRKVRLVTPSQFYENWGERDAVGGG